MSEKNKVSNTILEVLKIVIVLTILFLAYSWGALTNEDGGFNYDMGLFIILPVFVVGRSVYNFYRNFKYRKKTD